MILPQSVILKEVGPRIRLIDGNQLPIEQKLHWIHLLVDSGLSNIEVSSFIRTENKHDFNKAAELVLKLKRNVDLNYSVLVPNKRGLTRAFVVNADEVNLFVSASGTSNQKMKDCSIQHTMNEIRKIVGECKDNKTRTRAYIANVFGCRYEGNISFQKSINLANQLLEDGIDELSFIDSTGLATPPLVTHFLEELLLEVPKDRCSMQFDNTYGLAITNVYTSLLYGVERFESSNGGYGGSLPNMMINQTVATEDIISLMHQLGVYTGVDEQKLHEATNYISNQINKEPISKLFSVLKTE